MGRWPSNLLLNHHPECKLIGSKKVKTSSLLTTHTLAGKGSENTVDCPIKGHPYKNYGKDGYDIVEAWNCHPECPVRLLDQQSGITTSSKGGFTVKHQNNNQTHQWSKSGNWNTQEYINHAQWHTDKGGASRYFPRFFYSGKAYKTERNAGLMDLNNEQKYISKRPSGILYNNEEGSFDGLRRQTKNKIETLKPINLMRWLVRLITPPNGVVLDPFAGSGTTGIVCIIEGFNYILIEKREEFANTIIPKRLEYWSEPNHWSILKDHTSLEPIKNLQIKRKYKGLNEVPKREQKGLGGWL